MSEEKTVTKRRGRPRKTSYARSAKAVESENLQKLSKLEWFSILAKIIVLITALILGLIWRDYKLTDVGTTIVLLVLGFDFIALIISCLSYLMGLLLQDDKMISNSVKLMEFFIDVVICVILYLLAFHVRITWLYAGIMVMISYTVLSKDKKKVYLSYMVAIIAIIVYYFIIG
jgi:hypothetical protein